MVKVFKDTLYKIITFQCGLQQSAFGIHFVLIWSFEMGFCFRAQTGLDQLCVD